MNNYSTWVFVLGIVMFMREPVFIYCDVLLFPVVVVYWLQNKVKIEVSGSEKWFYIASILAFVLGFITHPAMVRFSTGMHYLMVVTMMIFIKPKHINKPSMLRVAKILTIVTLLALVISPLSGAVSDYVFWSENGKTRFQGILLEPSIQGIISGLFILLFVEYEKKGKARIVYSLLNLIFVISTYSGSGYLVLLVYGMLKMAKFLRFRYFIYAVIPSLVLVFVFGDKIAEFVFGRITSIFIGEMDFSTYIRFVAPWLLVGRLYETGGLLTGVGFGASPEWIKTAASDIYTSYGHDGEVEQIYNSIVYLTMEGGIILSALFVKMIYGMFKNANKVGKLLCAFLFVFTFVSGHFIHLFIWFAIHLINSESESLELNAVDHTMESAKVIS